MMLAGRTSTVLLVLMLALARGSTPASAAGPQLYGSGTIRPTAAGADFWVQLDDSTPLSFGYYDYSDGRSYSLDGPAQVDCLGDLFGGQAVRISGTGYDAATGATVTMQIYLVDGGQSGPDRFSLKVHPTDGGKVFLASMRDLESGDIVVGCPAA